MIQLSCSALIGPLAAGMAVRTVRTAVHCNKILLLDALKNLQEQLFGLLFVDPEGRVRKKPGFF